MAERMQRAVEREKERDGCFRCMIRGRERKTLYERDALEPWRERRERISEVQVDTRKIKVQEERADKDRELQRGREIDRASERKRYNLLREILCQE
jgi:hypothetical protein